VVLILGVEILHPRKTRVKDDRWCVHPYCVNPRADLKIGHYIAGLKPSAYGSCGRPHPLRGELQ
jgi:hypothetical protein